MAATRIRTKLSSRAFLNHRISGLYYRHPLTYRKSLDKTKTMTAIWCNTSKTSLDSQRLDFLHPTYPNAQPSLWSKLLSMPLILTPAEIETIIGLDDSKLRNKQVLSGRDAHSTGFHVQTYSLSVGERLKVSELMCHGSKFDRAEGPSLWILRFSHYHVKSQYIFVYWTIKRRPYSACPPRYWSLGKEYIIDITRLNSASRMLHGCNDQLKTGEPKSRWVAAKY